MKALGDGVSLEAYTEDTASDPVEEDTETTGDTELANTEAVQPSSNSSQLSVDKSLVPMSCYPTRNRKPPNRLA